MRIIVNGETQKPKLSIVETLISKYLENFSFENNPKVTMDRIRAHLVWSQP